MNKDDLEKSQNQIKNNVKSGIIFVVILAFALVVLGGGFLLKNSLSVFMLLLGLLIGLIGGFVGSLYTLAYFEVDKELQKALSKSESREPKP